MNHAVPVQRIWNGLFGRTNSGPAVTAPPFKRRTWMWSSGLYVRISSLPFQPIAPRFVPMRSGDEIMPLPSIADTSNVLMYTSANRLKTMSARFGSVTSTDAIKLKPSDEKGSSRSAITSPSRVSVAAWIAYGDAVLTYVTTYTDPLNAIE